MTWYYDYFLLPLLRFHVFWFVIQRLSEVTNNKTNMELFRNLLTTGFVRVVLFVCVVFFSHKIVFVPGTGPIASLDLFY